jgi:hypothetical protein
MIRGARTVVQIVVAVAAALVLAACARGPAGSAGPSTPASPTDAGAPTAAPGGDPGGTAPRAYTVDEAVSAEVDGPILVTGLLIDAGNGWRLCATIAESYPPQCGGAFVSVDGLDAAEFDLQQAGTVRWSEDATVVGTLDGDILTVTGSAAST